MPFNGRVIGRLGNQRDSCDAVGRKQPDGKSGTQGDPFQIQFERLAVHLKCVDALAIRRKVIRQVAFRIEAQIADIELRVAVQDGFELARQFGAAFEPLVLGHLAKVQIAPGLAVILGVRRFQKCHDGALRGIAVQRIFVLAAGLAGLADGRICAEAQGPKAANNR